MQSTTKEHIDKLQGTPFDQSVDSFYFHGVSNKDKTNMFIRFCYRGSGKVESWFGIRIPELEFPLKFQSHSLIPDFSQSEFGHTVLKYVFTMWFFWCVFGWWNRSSGRWGKTQEFFGNSNFFSSPCVCLWSAANKNHIVHARNMHNLPTMTESRKWNEGKQASRHFHSVSVIRGNVVSVSLVWKLFFDTT